MFILSLKVQQKNNVACSGIFPVKLPDIYEELLFLWFSTDLDDDSLVCLLF